MLRKLSLALAVSCASNGMAWAAEAPLSTKTDLVSVYQEAVDNNADLAAAIAQYGAQKEVVPQARAGLMPNCSRMARNWLVFFSDRGMWTRKSSALMSMSWRWNS